MRIVQCIWQPNTGWSKEFPSQADTAIGLVLCFGNKRALEEKTLFREIQNAFPDAEILICSGAGEISGKNIIDDGISLTAIEFSNTYLKTYSTILSDDSQQHSAGIEIAEALLEDDLQLLLVLADGQSINGSQLVAGFNKILQGKIPIVGGLAGDGSNFGSTLVGLNAIPEKKNIAAVGFYGDALQIGIGTNGGWVPFGPERKVTKSRYNVLYALDGKSALSLYKSYLGDLTSQLPASALRFPLSIKTPGNDTLIVRTILAVDEVEDSVTFAGDIPIGSTVRLMRAGLDLLLNGAEDSSHQTLEKGSKSPELAILVSCVGRRLIMAGRSEEEIELVADNLGDAAICGFYSYGEISSSATTGMCELHNQTMAITTISEK